VGRCRKAALTHICQTLDYGGGLQKMHCIPPCFAMPFLSLPIFLKKFHFMFLKKFHFRA